MGAWLYSLHRNAKGQQRNRENVAGAIPPSRPSPLCCQWVSECLAKGQGLLVRDEGVNRVCINGRDASAVC